MKYKKCQALCVLTATLMLCTQPSQVLADEQTGNTDVNQDVTMQVPGQAGNQSNGNTTNNTNSTSGESSNSTSGSVNNHYQPTAAESGAYNEKSSINNILKGYIDQIKNDRNFNTAGIQFDNTGLFSYGTLRVPDTDIANLLSHVQAFEGYLSQQEGLDRWTNIYDEVSVNEHPRKNLDPTEGDWDSLSADEKKAVKEKIAEQEGASQDVYCTGHYIPLAGTNNYQTHFLFEGSRNVPFSIWTQFPSYNYRGPYSDVRSDLIQGGFQDFNTWSGRFTGLSRFTSNSMEDYCLIGYIKDYHISNVKAHDVHIINWTSDQRRWKVINKDTGEVMHPDGADADGYIITDNPEHALTIAFDQAGHYQVIAEQKAKYYEGTTVSYDICDYLFDMETKNLLYFNEKTVSDGNGGSIYLGGEEREGWVATGDVFNWNVNNLGEIEKDGSTTQRVE